MPLILDAQLSLRTLFACHFTLTALVLMGNWPGFSYLFYNVFLLALLIWAETTPPVDSELPLLKCLVVEGISVLFDIIIMAARYSSVYRGIETFALVMAVFHLLGRLPSCFVLFRLREDRRTLQYGTATGGGGGGGSSSLGGGGGGIFGGAQTGPGGYEEFPPSYGAGGGSGGGGAGYTHDTKPLPP